MNITDLFEAALPALQHLIPSEDKRRILDDYRIEVFKIKFGIDPMPSGMLKWEEHWNVASDMSRNEIIQTEIDYILEDRYMETGFLNKSLN
jgi:hypothetical protein